MVAPPARPADAKKQYSKPYSPAAAAEEAAEVAAAAAAAGVSGAVEFDLAGVAPYEELERRPGTGSDVKMSFGGKPMWKHFAFVDTFVDAYLAKNHSHYQNMSAGPPGIMGLSSALLFVTSVLKSLEKEIDERQRGSGASGVAAGGSGRVVNKVSLMLEECSDLCNRFSMSTNDPNRLYETILQIVLKLKMMREGECMVLPGGWSCTEPPAEYHVVLYVITKARGPALAGEGTKGPEVFHFSVVNTGSGLEHHLQHVDPATGHILQNLAFTFRNVPSEKLVDGSFWFLLYRLLCFPSPTTSAAALYGVLLPWLNGVPLGAAPGEPGAPGSGGTAAAASAASAAAASMPGPGRPAGLGKPDTKRRYSMLGERAVEGDDSSAIDWRRPPLSTDSSRCYCIFETIFHVARTLGCNLSQAEATLVMVKAHIMRMLHSDLGADSPSGGPVSISSSEEMLIRSACTQMAREATVPDPEDLAKPFLDELLSLLRSVAAKAAGLQQLTAGNSCLALVAARKAGGGGALPAAGLGAGPLPGPLGLPLWGRLRTETGVEHLAGSARVPAIVLPVQLSLVADHVATYHDLATAMRHCVHACVQLANQAHLIKNTFALRASLIQQLFLEVAPLPLPCDSPPDRRAVDWWATQAAATPMRYETQADLLRLLSLCSQHYAAVSLSLTVTRSFDATRLTTLAAMAAIADAVMRIKACDVPSLLSLHYAGDADGPVSPFCFDAGHFALESEFSRFHDPLVGVARTKVLDYFLARRRATRDDHVVFGFERSMALSVGEQQLMSQVCLSMGFDQGGIAGTKGQQDRLGAFLAGEDPTFVDLYPELGFFRDLVYLFKALMCPSGAALPELKPWHPSAARLHWKFNDKKSVFEVSAFDQKVLRCNAFLKDPDAEAAGGASSGDGAASGEVAMASAAELQDLGEGEGGAGAVAAAAKKKGGGGWGAALFSALGLTTEAPRAPPSGADPSSLTGQRILNEDDVLHVKCVGGLRPPCLTKESACAVHEACGPIGSPIGSLSIGVAPLSLSLLREVGTISLNNPRSSSL